MKKVTPVKTFEDLDYWKHCRTLRLFVAKEVVPALPKDERYRLGDGLLNGYMAYLKRATSNNE